MAKRCQTTRPSFKMSYVLGQSTQIYFQNTISLSVRSKILKVTLHLNQVI